MILFRRLKTTRNVFGHFLVYALVFFYRLLNDINCAQHPSKVHDNLIISKQKKKGKERLFIYFSSCFLFFLLSHHHHLHLFTFQAKKKLLRCHQEMFFHLSCDKQVISIPQIERKKIIIGKYVK